MQRSDRVLLFLSLTIIAVAVGRTLLWLLLDV